MYNTHTHTHKNHLEFSPTERKTPCRWFGLCCCGHYYTQLLFVLEVDMFLSQLQTIYIYVCSLFHGPSHFEHAVRAEKGVIDVHF